ncbi:hypothetical protein SAMN06265218_11215 [Fodinibius sediminis]|uniref:Uncharacterized protein n=1 Tax=Fodinibius sediminis TaxID=1214077 RepID=A0A521DWG9_9BACT|nr:hypothetical protein SAMN06265218_11215 [Fodinibius sediminis]
MIVSVQALCNRQMNFYCSSASICSYRRCHGNNKEVYKVASEQYLFNGRLPKLQYGMQGYIFTN